MLGGKVVGSGTYGCILKPAVPCKGETNRPPEFVSKLMEKSDADSEFDVIISIKKKLHKIPNHNDYYIINSIKKTKHTEKIIGDLTMCIARTDPNVVMIQETQLLNTQCLWNKNLLKGYTTVAVTPATLSNAQQELRKVGKPFGRPSGGLMTLVKTHLKDKNLL